MNHVCFITRERKRLDPDGRGDEEDLGGAAGEETVIKYIA